MRLLDLFCGAGGAAMGYHRAGFTEIVGVDIKPQPRYPFTFVQADALEYVREHGREFAAIHASPPCQAYTQLRNLFDKHNKARLLPEPPDLIAPTREALMESGRVYVIENVWGAPLKIASMLCGSAFGLRVRRHRWFESNVFLWSTGCRHKTQGRPVGVYDSGGWKMRTGLAARTTAEAQSVMEMPWADYRGCTQAIPPAYSEFIGRQLLQALGAQEAGG